MECHKCGAHLPLRTYGEVRCEYCSSLNYIPVPGEKEGVAEKVGAKKEPTKKEETQKLDLDSSTEDKPSNSWYLLPVFAGLIGGLIAYFKLKKRDEKMAKNCIYLIVIAPFLTIFLIALASLTMPSIKHFFWDLSAIMNLSILSVMVLVGLIVGPLILPLLLVG